MDELDSFQYINETGKNGCYLAICDFCVLVALILTFWWDCCLCSSWPIIKICCLDFQI